MDCSDIRLDQLIEFAKAYARLGWPTQEQLDDLLRIGDLAEINPNALQRIEDGLGPYDNEIGELAESWRHSNPEGDDRC